MEVLGSPTEEDLSFITDQTALNYLKEFECNFKGIDFLEKFPYAGADAIDLIKRMVTFNPFFRISVEDCLNHPYFATIRKKSMENISALKHIEIDIDKIEGSMTYEQLHDHLVDLILLFRSKRIK